MLPEKTVPPPPPYSVVVKLSSVHSISPSVTTVPITVGVAKSGALPALTRPLDPTMPSSHEPETAAPMLMRFGLSLNAKVVLPFVHT